MLWWRTVLVGFVHTLPLVLMVVGEPFYQRRDHLDQAKYMKISNENVVKDRTDAQQMLSKYGYLACQLPRKKRGATHRRRQIMTSPPMNNFLAGILEEGGMQQACDESAVQKAIRDYQRTYNLPDTGELDEETKSLMSTSRCGNKDSEKDDEPSTSSDKDESELDVLVNENNKLSQEQDNLVSTDDEEDNKTSHIKGHRLWKRSAKSQLYKILTGEKPRTRTQADHRRHLEEYEQRLRSEAKGKRRLLHRYTPKERRKRSIHVWMPRNLPLGKYIGENGELFNKDVVRWRLLTTGFSTRIPLTDQRGTIDLAFRMWSEVIPLRFVEDTNSNIHDVDIEIAFGRGSHQNCEHDFDGNGGEIAHSWNVGNMHFDDAENFKSIRSFSPDGIYLLRVAVHEIGHVLGLAHTNRSYSIMYAIYNGAELAPDFELSPSDRHDIQNIYGVCKGSFNTVFDWVRRRPDNHFVYNTYFFRDNHYWMYENHANRTRYGDPLYIANEWEGVPNSPDGYVHVWVYNGADVIYHNYFFKGEYFYKYNNTADKVADGWPRLISEDFGPKPGGSEGIPNNIDSVFFDTRDVNLYFFKDDDVYVYSVVGPEEERGCCVRKSKIVDEFPAAEGHEPLPSNLDAVYYSHSDNMMYFLKGERLWKNVLFDPRQRRTHNSIEYVGYWYDKWVDICDVAVMNEH